MRAGPARALWGSSALSLGRVARLRLAHTSGDRRDQREHREEPEARSRSERDRLDCIDHDDAYDREGEAENPCGQDEAVRAAPSGHQGHRTGDDEYPQEERPEAGEDDP